MRIYQSADGQLWTEDGLYRQTKKDLRVSWDEETQGSFEDSGWTFSDWLIEAINTGVIKGVEVND